MDAAYKSLLPPNLQSDVDKIEISTGKVIGVAVLGTPAAAQYQNVWDGLGTGVYLTPQEATIILATPNVPRHSLAHEVIHIRRKWLDGVPCYAFDGRLDQGLQNIVAKVENDLEHIFVIREEIQAFPEAARYWRGEYGAPEQHVQDFEMAARGDRAAYFISRDNLLKGYLTTRLGIQDDETVGKYYAFLDQLQLRAEADALTDGVAACTSMEEILGTAANYLLPRRLLQMWYHDAKNSRFRVVPLPVGRPRTVDVRADVLNHLTRG